ncbi:MAG: PQQ-binding-like beta-propeller repeat protein [Anaerolineae bacterium]
MKTTVVLPLAIALVLLVGVYTPLAGLTRSATDYTLTTADGLTLTLSADGQVTSLQIGGDELVATSAPALLLRDLSDAGAVVEPNLVPNPGFEEELADWLQVINSGLDVSVVVSPTHSGDAALQFASTNDIPAFAAYASDSVSVAPGQRYRVSAWWRSATGYVSFPSGAPTLWQMNLWRDPQRTNGLYVQWFDADSQPLGDPELATPLHWNAAHWRIIRRELTAPPDAAFARVVVGAKLAGQTLWVDDVALVPAPEPEVAVGGTVVPCAPAMSSHEVLRVPGNSWELRETRENSEACLVQSASLPESGLVISVTYTAHADHIAIHGEIADTAGRDRALDMTWGVPLEATNDQRRTTKESLRSSWIWWDEVHTSRPITDTGIYAHAISAIYDGWLPISLYPYAGIALALPLDRPQLALLAYDGAKGRYGATFHLGISPQATRLGNRATFDLLLYRFDPAWGFRDVIARHRALQPEAYTTALPLYDYADAEQGWYFTENGVQRALAEDAANVYSAQYTVGELPLRIAPSTDPRPTLDQALAVVTATLSSPREWEAALARAITQSAVVDPNGDWSLKHIGIYPWAPDWWEASWAANLDPDLADGLAAWNLAWRITPAFTATTEAGAHLDGVQIDNFMSTPAFDLRSEALAVTDWPLAYNPHTYQPAVHNGFAFHEYLAFLRDYLDANWGVDRGISINFWGLGHPNYLAEYIDAFGSEGNLKGDGEGPNWNPEILDYRRAIAYGRPYLFANQTPGLTATEAYTFSQLALLYGVRPRRGPNAADWDPEAETIISDTVQLVTRYWAAGWEPLTYARANSDDVWIERFGSLTNDGRLTTNDENRTLVVDPSFFVAFPIHNRTDITRTVTITIETAPLGLTDPTTATISDLASEQPMPFSVVDGNIVVGLTLGPRETRVLQVSGGVAPPTPTPTPTAPPTPTATPTVSPTPSPSYLYLPLVVHNAVPATPTPSPTGTSPATATIDANPDHGWVQVASKGRNLGFSGLDVPALTTAAWCDDGFCFQSFGTDCDDNDPLTYPGAEERADLKDNNCNGFEDKPPVGFTREGYAAGPPWPTFGHDPQHTGRSEYNGPRNPVRLWAYAVPRGRMMNFAPSVDADGTIYVGTWGDISEGNAPGKLYALRPDGSLKWLFDPGLPEQPSQGQHPIWGTIEASVAIDPLDGTLYFGRGDNKLYALNPDGTKKWEFATFPTEPERLPELGGQVIGSPVQDEEGTIYFGTIPYTEAGVPALWAVNRDGTERWHVEVEGAVWSSPAIGPDGTVYFGSWDGNFYAVQDLGQGSYRLKTPFRPAGPYTNWFMTPAIGPDGTIYATATEVRGICQGRARLFALTDTGDALVEKWSITAENDWEQAFNGVIASDGTLFVGSGSGNNHQNVCHPADQGNLYRVTDNGPGVAPRVELLYEAGGAVGVSLIDADGIIYFSVRGDLKAGKPGQVFAVYPDGSPAWPAPYQAAGEIWLGTPALGANGALYFADAPCADVLNILPCDEAPALYALGDVADDNFLFGIGYATGGLAAAFANTGVRQAKLGYSASWNDIEPDPPEDGVHSYRWDDLDKMVAEYQSYGFSEVHITLQSRSHWGTQLDCGFDCRQSSLPKEEHWEDYEAYVRAVVERYDGDGADDMDGLRYPVRQYEIETEADGWWEPSCMEDPQDPDRAGTYLQLLDAAQRVAREAYPEVQIFPGAMYFYGLFSGDPDEATIAARRAERPWVDCIVAFNEEVLRRPELFDGVEFHFLGDDYREIAATIRWLRGQMEANGYQKPIYPSDAVSAPSLVPMSFWETLYPQDTVKGYLDVIQDNIMSDAPSQEYLDIRAWYAGEQAEFTVKLLLTAMAEGAAGMQLAAMTDFPWMFCTPTWWPNAYAVWNWGVQGMVEVDWGPFVLCFPMGYELREPRPVFHTLRWLIAKLQGFSSVERPSLMPPEDSLEVYAYEVQVRDRPIYVLWAEDGVGQVMGEVEPSVTVTLPVATTAVTVTYIITETGQSDPLVEVLPAASGVVHLTVTETPILVEGVRPLRRVYLPIVLR